MMSPYWHSFVDALTYAIVAASLLVVLIGIWLAKKRYP